MGAVGSAPGIVLEWLPATRHSMQPQRATARYQDVSLLDEWTRVFQQHAGDARHLTREQFKLCLQVRDDYLSNRIFDLFDTNRSGSLEMNEFLGMLGDLLLG